MIASSARRIFGRRSTSPIFATPQEWNTSQTNVIAAKASPSQAKSKNPAPPRPAFGTSWGNRLVKNAAIFGLLRSEMSPVR